MAYSQVTLNTLTDELSRRLADPNKDFWSTAELQSFIVEGLRIWQAITREYTEQITFPLDQFGGAAHGFYDVLAHASLAPTLTDRDLIVDIQRALMEPVTDGSSWPGTEMFTLAQVAEVLQRRRDLFNLEAGLSYSMADISVSASTTTVPLPQYCAQVRRAHWTDQDDQKYLLPPADPLSLTIRSQVWFGATGARPKTWQPWPADRQSLVLNPIPTQDGTLTILANFTGAPLTPASSATVLGVPNDFCWVLKYGALADLLSQDGPAFDPQRADYCRQRWDLGIEIAKRAPYILMAYLNSRPVLLGAIFGADTHHPGWMNLLGPARRLLFTSNIFYPLPRPLTPGSVVLDVARTFPVPSGGSYIQLDQAWIPYILDYALHCATFKESGAELRATRPLLERFLTQGIGSRSERLRALAPAFPDLQPTEDQDQGLRPERKVSGLSA